MPTGTDVMILKIFSLKKTAKKLAFFTQNKAKSCKVLIITLDFEKNANFFAENWQKSQKIVIITSTAGQEPIVRLFSFQLQRQRYSRLERFYIG
jgi:hypothetical protein